MKTYRFAIRSTHGSWLAPCRYDHLGKLQLPLIWCQSINDAALYKAKGNAKAFLSKAVKSNDIKGVEIVPLYLTTF